MELEVEKTNVERVLEFYGGAWSALLPFVIFVCGVVFVALSGAPDERGFWPILLLAIVISLLLAKNKKHFSEKVIEGMSEPIVMIMITAWILASIIGVLMTNTGFVEALVWLASQVEMGGVGFVLATFLICCVVSLSTGSSFATILICGPLLYPSGGMLGSHLPTLAGAIIGGATFGDFFAPISDTTIASALSQKAEIGPTVKSRLKFIIPAMIIAFIAYYLSAALSDTTIFSQGEAMQGSPSGLPMLLVPAFVIYLFLRGKHLLHGLLLGLVFGVILSLVLGLLPIDRLISLDLDNMVAKSFVIDGINRAVGISFFTILLMGLVATLKASGLVAKLVAFAERYSNSKKAAEGWIAATTMVAVLLTTHSVVAILTVSEFSNKTGDKIGLDPIRRSNIMSLVVCVFPFLLPYFIPVILVANTTNSGSEFSIESVNALSAGMHNFIAWALLLMTVLTLVFGYGRREKSDRFADGGETRR